MGWGHIRILDIKPQKTIKSPDRLYKAPTHYTKPRHTVQSPNTLYKAPKRVYKDPTISDTTPNYKQILKMLNKSSNKYQLTYDIQYLIPNSTY